MLEVEDSQSPGSRLVVNESSSNDGDVVGSATEADSIHANGPAVSSADDDDANL